MTRNVFYSFNLEEIDSYNRELKEDENKSIYDPGLYPSVSMTI